MVVYNVRVFEDALVGNLSSVRSAFGPKIGREGAARAFQVGLEYHTHGRFPFTCWCH